MWGFSLMTQVVSNNSVIYFLNDSHYVSVNCFTIRTGIFQSGIPFTGTSYYFYMVALADWVTTCSQYPIGETFQPDATDKVEV